VGNSYELQLLNPGTANDQIALSYASLGILNGSNTGASGGASLFDVRAFGWGLPSVGDQIPTSGTSTYTGVVYGFATGNGSTAAYDIRGTLQLQIDFAARNFTGTITLTGTDDKTGRVVSFGSYPVTSITQNLADLLGTIGDNLTGFRSALAGPHAEELYGGFTLDVHNPTISAVPLTIVAGVVAKR
jgi:hypothetical protein